jgi:hypothetical protein
MLENAGFCVRISELGALVLNMTNLQRWLPITVAARSKAGIVFARSNAGIVGSNPTQGLDVCVRLFCICVVLCVGSGLEMGWSSVQGVLPTIEN